MNIIFTLNHVARALARLPVQFVGKLRISGVVQALAEQSQEAETAFYQLHEGRGVNTAVGVQLDGVGTIVGLPRIVGQDDADYRDDIKTKIVQNKNQGTPEEIIAAAKFFLDADEVIFNELYPAGVSIFSTVVVDDDDQKAYLKQRVKRLLPAGVALSDFGNIDETNAFRFTTGPGLGDTDNPATGGLLADLY